VVKKTKLGVVRNINVLFLNHEKSIKSFRSRSKKNLVTIMAYFGFLEAGTLKCQCVRVNNGQMIVCVYCNPYFYNFVSSM